MIENKAASTSNKDANEMAMSSSVCVEKYPRIVCVALDNCRKLR